MAIENIRINTGMTFSKNNAQNLRRWTVVFRVLANINRLKIIKMLYGERRMNVTEIADELKISFKATSNHLAMLRNLGVLEAQGTAGHVFYCLNPDLPGDFRAAVKLM